MIQANLKHWIKQKVPLAVMQILKPKKKSNEFKFVGGYTHAHISDHDSCWLGCCEISQLKHDVLNWFTLGQLIHVERIHRNNKIEIQLLSLYYPLVYISSIMLCSAILDCTQCSTMSLSLSVHWRCGRSKWSSPSSNEQQSIHSGVDACLLSRSVVRLFGRSTLSIRFHLYCYGNFPILSNSMFQWNLIFFLIHWTNAL